MLDRYFIAYIYEYIVFVGIAYRPGSECGVSLNTPQIRMIWHAHNCTWHHIRCVMKTVPVSSIIFIVFNNCSQMILNTKPQKYLQLSSKSKNCIQNSFFTFQKSDFFASKWHTQDILWREHSYNQQHIDLFNFNYPTGENHEKHSVSNNVKVIIINE